MLEKITDTREATFTIAAMVRLYATMGRRVSDQTFSVGKRLVALIALVGLLSGVHPFVHFQLALVQEAGTAVVAQMAFLTRMFDHVGIQRRLGQV